VLNTSREAPEHLDETLATFAYVNGELLRKSRFRDFNRDMRDVLLACTGFDWSRISPEFSVRFFRLSWSRRNEDKSAALHQ